MDVKYLFTPEQYRHLGVAGALATHAFDWAREKHYSIRPSASYIRDDFVPNNAAGLGFTYRPLTGASLEPGGVTGQAGSDPMHSAALHPGQTISVIITAARSRLPRVPAADLCELTPNFDAKNPTPGLDRALAQTGAVSRR
jgi:hypothetical protein